MKITLKKAAAILMITISSLSFSEDDRTGFLSNMRELKEISDIMDIIQDSYVENANAQKNKEEKNKKNKNTNQKNTGVTKKSLMQGALKGMMESLDDPHSVYFTKEEKNYQLFLENLTVSPIKGTKGNIEYLVEFSKKDKFSNEEIINKIDKLFNN